jgi:hypothetical protein
MRRIGPFEVKLALGDEVGRGCGLLLSRDRVGHPPAGALEIAKPREEIGITCEEPPIEASIGSSVPGGWLCPIPGGTNASASWSPGGFLKRVGEGEQDRPASQAGLAACRDAPAPIGGMVPMRKAYSSGLTGRRDRDVQTRSTATACRRSGRQTAASDLMAGTSPPDSARVHRARRRHHHRTKLVNQCWD